MSSWAMRSSSWISASLSTISVRRLSAYLVPLNLFRQLHDDDVVEELRAGEDGAVARDGVRQLAVLLGQLLLLEAREARQAHLEDGLGLALGQTVRRALLGLVDLALRPSRPPDEVLQPLQGQRHQGAPRHVGIGALADGLHHEIHVRHRDPEALDDLPLVLGLAQLGKAGSPRDHVAPVGDERLQHRLDVQDRRATLHDGEVDDAEGRLQIGLPVEVVDDHLGDDVLLQLDDQAHAVAVALVAHLPHALQLLVAHQLRRCAPRPGRPC